MHTEKKKILGRFGIYLLFWSIIVCLGFFLIPGGGTGNGGTGTGTGTHGQGSGRGQGVSGDDEGKSGSGKQTDGTAAASQVTAPPVAHPGASPQGRGQKKTQPQTKKATLSVVDKNDANEDTATIYLPTKAVGSSSSSGTEAGFFGVPVDGPVIFLLDRSGSMSSSTKDGQMSRLELVKKEITQTLQSKFAASKRKKNRDHFRIVCFDSVCSVTPDAGSKGYKFSSMENVAKAIDFVKSLSPGGGTDMKRAWSMIIPIIRSEGIKSVYFLSDGDPTDCSPSQLLNYLKTSVPSLQIHTISMGTNSQLLKDIAAQHKGLYREVH